MDEKEFNNTYAIPANYTDSGKLLGGMLETRNTIEAIIMLGPRCCEAASPLPARHSAVRRR